MLAGGGKSRDVESEWTRSGWLCVREYARDYGCEGVATWGSGEGGAGRRGRDGPSGWRCTVAAEGACIVSALEAVAISVTWLRQSSHVTFSGGDASGGAAASLEGLTDAGHVLEDGACIVLMCRRWLHPARDCAAGT